MNPTDTCSLYFACGRWGTASFVKFGIAISPEHRMREHSRSNPFKSEIRPELRALIDTTAEIASALEREIKSLTRQWPVWRPGISRGLAPSIMPSGEWIVYSTMATHHAVVDTMSTACEALRSSRLEKAPSAVSILDELSLLVLSKEAL